ncbi:hypothetical protein ACLOJK_019619 [Asimina triloba]
MDLKVAAIATRGCRFESLKTRMWRSSTNRDSSCRIQCETLESANRIIGHTTEERVLKAKRQPSGVSESKAIAGEDPILKKEKQHADLDPMIQF